jgi:hypothetical protein
MNYNIKSKVSEGTVMSVSYNKSNKSKKNSKKDSEKFINHHDDPNGEEAMVRQKSGSMS